MVLVRWQTTIVDDAGNVLPNAQVEVRREEAGAPLATIYQDRDGTTPLGNPFSANAAPFAADGFVWFHAPAGAYRITVTSGAFSRTHRYVGIGLAQEQDSPPVGASWRYASATADADPGAGLFRLDNADPASATAIYVDAQDKDGVAQGAWLETLDDGGESSDRGILVLRSVDNAAVLVARVTGSLTVNGSPPGYYAIPIIVLSASAPETFVAEAVFGFVFSRSGSDGVDGDGDVTGPNGGTVEGQFAQFGDMSGKDIVGGTMGDSPPTPLRLASDAHVRQAEAGRMLQSGHLNTANALVALTDAATVAMSWPGGFNRSLVLTANRELGFPTDIIVGQHRMIVVAGNDGTGRELSLASGYVGAGTLTGITSTRRAVVSLWAETAGRVWVSYRYQDDT